MKSFLQVRRIFKQFQPQAVIGVGGYSSFPVLRYAQSQGIATFIHESNSFAGKSNQLLGKKATKIFVATDGMEQFFPSKSIFISGNPVRASIAHATVTRAEALHFFGLDATKKTILAVGGSLGAKSINEALAQHIHQFASTNLQLIWQTGKTTAQQYKAIGANQPNIWVNDFITQMEMAYAAADVVVSRSGAMAVTELCVAKKPVVFVPFPFAAEDHQTVNAMSLVRKNAALLVKDSDAANLLVSTVIDLANNEALQQQLQHNIAALAINNADETIAKEILKYIPQP
jgi:UDP-N-acetylglucosamine--N-acetylmuramyl-(pentapeptide) pyrophosphoryl-undecaprenol N-acetylglucosamine transferase